MNKVTDLSGYNNDRYKREIGESFIKQVLWYFVNMLFFINPLNPSSSIKFFLLKIFGAKLGKGVVIKPGVNIKYAWKLEIGDHSWIGENVWIDNLAPVIIGNNVCVSQGAMLLTGNHNFSLTSFDLIVKEINLEDGSWVGAKAVVCPGVTCGSHSVLTVMSVASHDLLPYGIYRGNPAQLIKERTIS